MKTHRVAGLFLTASILGCFGPVAQAASFDQCIIALNASASGAVSMSGSVNVNAVACGIVIDSSSTSALRLTGNSQLTGKYVNVVGGVGTNGGSSVSPAPTTQASALPNPLTFLTPPSSSGQCDHTNTSVAGSNSVTLSPGTYCNGITVSGNASVTLNPGTYILFGGGLKMSGSSRVTGTGVTFFLTGGSGHPYGPASITGSAALNASAPTAISSPYFGILFYQDPALGTGLPASTMSGDTTATIEGVLYFPTTSLTYSGSSNAGNYLIIVADTVDLNGNATINANFPGRSPLEPPVSVTVNPGAPIVYPGQTQQFVATVNNSTQGVTWSLNPASLGTIDANGLYTAPTGTTSPQSVTVTATSQEDPTKSASATVTLLPPISVLVTPAGKILYGSQTQQFSASVVNTSNTAVTWSVSPAVGSVSATGLYTAPATIATQQSVMVIATSQADPTKSAAAAVTLMPPVAVSVSSPSASTFSVQPVQLSATVINTNNSAVTWSLRPANVGTISATGLYTPPAVVTSQQTVTITATSQADSSKSASTTITLLPLSLTVGPTTSTLFVTQTQQFTATVTNGTNGAVNWTINPSVGSISSGGIYTAPSTLAAQQAVTVTATSQADPTKSASVTLTLVPVSINVTPATASAYASQTQQFTATVTNAPVTSVTWSITPAGVGTINATGLYTAPALIASQQTVTITATSQADSTKSASATLTLTPVSVTLAPTAATLFVGQTQQFTPTVANTTNTAVTWSISPSGAGTISSTGLYTAPASIATQQTVTVTATSVFDSTKSAAATVTLAPVTLSVSPNAVTLFVGQSQTFTATVTNATNTGVTWSINPNVGSITAGGVYTAPASIASQQVVTITATSQADSSKTATATVTLAPVVISVGPATTTLSAGATQQFTATVTNATDTSVIWSISPSGTGTISAAGLYTAPSTILDNTTVTVTATSNADSTKSASATLTLRISTITISPQTASLNIGQTQQFTTGATNVTWSVTPTGAGTVSTSGLYTAPASIATQQNVTVTVTSVADNTKAASATVTLNPVTVTVAPTSVPSLNGGQSQTFTATVTNTTNTNVTWSISPAGVGTITTAGAYTAPSTVTSQQTVTITATSQADSSKSANATVTLVPVTLVSLTPQTISLTASQTQQFNATVTGAGNTAVTWTITPALGTVSSTGLYTAPNCIDSQQTVTITATSAADTTKSTSATITLLTSNPFKYQRAIVVNHTKVPNTDQANFPMLVSVTDPALASAANGGHVASATGLDIVFTSDVTCQTKLNYEIELWNPATGQLIAWVQIPLLSHSADTIIQLCYGSSAITTSQSNPTGTWDTNFSAVYHLAGTTSVSGADSTTNANNGTLSGVAAAAGEVDGAGQFNGTASFMSVPPAVFGNPLATGYSLTFSVWFKTSSDGVIIGQVQGASVASGANPPPLGVPALYVGNDGKVRSSFFWHNQITPITSKATYNDNAWHLAADTYSGGTETLYIDGKKIGSLSLPEFPFGSAFTYFLGTGTTNFGPWPNTNASWFYFNGTLDEVKVSAVARSADWLTAEYNNQSAPSAFYTMFPENGAAISLSPLTSFLSAAQSQQFTPTFIGTCTTAVTWSITPATAGSINTSGLYTAPAVISTQQTVMVTATSLASSTVAGSASVVLEPPITLTVSPQTSAMTANQAQQFTATVLNTPNTAVTWAISPTTIGSVSAAGLYTAPSSIAVPQTVTITATSVADNTKSASTTIALVNANAFTYHRPIVIDHTKVPNSDQSNFAVLISGTYSFLASAANGGKVQSPNGFDIIFTGDCNGLNKLNYEIESYNPATGQIAAWVQVPLVSHTTDTVIYMSYGESSIASNTGTPAATWDANYQAVWHLNGATTLGADSTSNSFNGTVIGANATTGQIGGAANFNGSGQYIDIGSMGTIPTKGTVSMWVNVPTRAGSPNAFSTSAFLNQCNQFRIGSHSNGTLFALDGNQTTDSSFFPDCGANDVTPSFTTDFVPFVWHYLTVTWDFSNPSTKPFSTFYDGVPSQGVTNGIVPNPNVFDDVKIGIGVDINHGWNGQIDEVRMSNIIRSSDWIATEYNNQNSPSTFYAIYPENTGAITVTPQNSALYATQTLQFAATVVGNCSAPSVTWSVSGTGSISAAGLYTAPAGITTPQSVTITATTQTNPIVSGSANLTLLPPASVTVSPSTATLFNGDSQQFSASVANAINTAVTWTVNPSGTGTVSTSGLYTAPATISSQQNIAVVATSVADSTKSASAAVTLVPGQGSAVTGGSFTAVFDLIAQGLCRKPHLAPVVSAGLDQRAFLANGAASAALTGTVLDYSLEPGQTLTYSWSLVSGPASVQFGTPSATSTQATFTAAGTYTLQFSVNDGIATSATTTHVNVFPTPPGTASMFLNPAVSGPAAVQTPVTVQATAVSFLNGPPVVHFQVSGANNTSGDVQSVGGGDVGATASFTYFGGNPGTDTIIATASICCPGTLTSNTVTVNWVAAPPKITTSPVTGQFFTADGSGAFNTPKTQQPLFTETFPNINFNPVATLTRPFTDIETDQNGNPVGSIVAQGTNYQAGVATLYNFSAVFTGSLNVPAAGPVTFTFSSDDAFIFGVGKGATSGGGPQVNTPTATPFGGYPVMGGVNQRSALAQSSITVNFPAAGIYPYEVDYAKGGDKNLSLTMLSGGIPIPAAALLTLSPSTVPSITGGQIETLNVTATDSDGVAITNQQITVNIAGINAQSRTLITDATGQTSFSYAGSPFLTGLDQVQASATINGAAAFSNVVNVNWNNGVNQAPSVSAGSAQTVTLPNPAILTGIVSDDGLPNNTLSITWSVVSGPGTVTFDDPNQAATAAFFSNPGTYTLQLSASDGTLTTTSTVSIAAQVNTTRNSGWIASPTDNSSISGQVPIVLVSGITLQPGATLTYAPSAGTPATPLTITAASGQIAIFDTTLLPNGIYFIELDGTNTAGVTQKNVVLVHVIGDYKPGRVTATVTDLTVPAPGLAIKIDRTYDSLTRSTKGDFGFGWNLGVTIQTEVNLGGDVTLTLNGRRRVFYFTPQPNQVFTSYFTPVYTPEPGVFGSLVNTGDNCNGVLVHVGTLYECAINNAGAVYQATGFRYTDAYGRVYTMDANGSLQSVQDLSGNTLTITASGISSTNGLNVPFVRDTSGRITKITDTLGNSYVYTYDTNGNLSTVTYPQAVAGQLPTQYQYDPTHLLTQETDQRGNVGGTTTYYPDGKLKTVTDAVGNTTQFAYNLATSTTTVTNPDGGIQTTVYDAYGSPLQVTDPLNRVTKYTYDANHNQSTVTDPLNKVTTYTYDSNGFRTSLKDPLGNTWSAVYNQVGGPTTVTNPLNQAQTVTYDSSFRISAISDSIGQVAAFTYNAAGLPLTLKDARGNTSNYAYDQFGNRTSYSDPLSRATTSVYDTQGNLSSQTDPRLNKTQYGYDTLNRKTSTTDALNNVTHYTYDANGNKATETDPLTRVTTYTYDSANRLTQIKYADNTTRSYTYDFRGNKLTDTDQLNRVTKYVYDLAGQLTSTTVAFGTVDAATTSYTYDLAGRKLTQTDPRGNVTTYAYDAAGRQTSVKDAVGNITQFGYDGKGQRTSLTDAKNRVTTYTYDARGRQLSTTTPDQKTVTKTYDGLGLVLTVTDEENNTTTYGYDAASQLVSVTDALHQITSYSYDPAGNKISQTDANNHTTSYAYDALNRRTSRTLPLTQIESFTYDAVGNKQTRVDFNGKTTTYAYDSLNRLLSRTPDASFNAQPISFTYTSTGQRATMIDPSGTTTYAYTNRDQVASKATPEGTLTYTYDLSGNVASVLSSNANGTSVAYAWDADNRLQTVTDNRTNGSTTYSYDATNQLAAMVYPNGVTHSYAYDTRDRLTTLNVHTGTAMLASYMQTFSPSGRKLSAAEGTGRTPAYNYDVIYRLLNETISGDPTAANNGALSYVLDPVGNRLSLTSTLAALPSQSFTYDADDRISGDTFDANGNTITSGGVTYSYDFEDRLVSTSSGVQIVYDGDGNRVSETANGVTTKFLVDTLTPTGYAEVAEEIVSGSVSAQFTYGVTRNSQNRVGSVSYYGYDGGGSVRQLFNGGAAVTDTYSYDAFGNAVAQTGSTVNEFMYRGEQFDSLISLYYLRARYYSAVRGHFLTEDSFQGWLESPLSLNGYVFAEADAANNTDPSGFEITFRGIVAALLRGPVVVIGRVTQAARFSCLPYCNVLSPTGWSPLVQAQWLKAVINGRYIIVLASAPTVQNIIGNNPDYNEGLTVFGMELVALIEAGWTQWGRFMIPPM